MGENIYYSKIDAVVDNVKSSNPITWHILENELNGIDTTVEPSETLEELYAERARKIREQYDYLVIHFSGGTDSSKIVDIFYRNNIRVDEIFHRTYNENERKKASACLGDPEAVEVEALTNPRLDFIKSNLWPDIKIRQLDITDGMIEAFDGGKWFREKYFSSTDVSVPWRSDWEISVPEWLRLTNQGMKIGHIIGKEKPLVYKDDIGYYFVFTDKFVNSWIMPRRKFVGYPMYKELFYLHPDCAKMIIKQAHILKNNIKNNDWIFDPNLNNGGRKRENIIADVIYGNTVLGPNVSSIKDGDRKTPLNLGRITSGTGWWITRDTTTDHFKSYVKGLRDSYTELKPKYDNFLHFYKRGLPTYMSRKYYISYHNV